MSGPVASIADLSIAMLRDGQEKRVIDGVSLHVGAGEIVGLVGESGSGKSVTAMSLLRLLPRLKTRYGAGSKISVLGHDVLALDDAKLRDMRGSNLSIIFQEPMTALNPVVRIERQMCEVIRRHRDVTPEAARDIAFKLLADTHIADPERALRAFPHELSGGMRQRVMIAMAFSCDPSLIIADEATTALDVTVQAQILSLLTERARETGTAVLMISHDLAVINQTCDRVYVMYKGAIVEEGATAKVIAAPDHPYTRALLNALPGRCAPRTRLATVAAAMMEGGPVAASLPPAERSLDPAAPPVLQVDRLSVRYPRRFDMLGQVVETHTAVDDVSFRISPGETLSLVGESGCGKSSLLNALVGLVAHEGDVRCDRQDMQLVFQDPQSSLDPRWPVWRIVTEPLAARRRVSRAERRDVAAELFAKVGLDASAIDRLPHEFSGGQRQRIAVGRALSVRPKLLLLDEPTSALDVSVQAQVLNLLMDLQDREGLAYLFVSHDLGVVRHISDRIAIMKAGCIVESGDAAAVLADPSHAYTRTLLSAVPQL
ncbi:dipeptide ABC transporter ATP-binding protein [Sphingomonas crocodyli]|uniref:ABC transporter ATP-binding protein n=1 Tax=Sphingomonas crocodyli TaxID=1979270 RepID=A0A437M031_9SPHN|nr:ABC transporter ATP-binding protein [Sphingomonas crocodyli]RVT90982.1 ABC transporter ATP-binding protein [Sphingomonas crocodyli]